MEKMANSAHKLISLGTDSLGPTLTPFTSNFLKPWGKLGRELAEFLKIKNGFYAFESALHVFPLCGWQGEMDVEQWNDPKLWINCYGDMALDTLFFAEGIFADQFAIRKQEIIRFQAETGLAKPVASTLEDWASLILKDYSYQTGWPFAHEWQTKHGRLPYGERLVATIPFVMEGDYKVSNFHALDAVKAMRYHGDIALQIRDLPDGTKIRLEVVD